jgi:hypothetical protein
LDILVAIIGFVIEWTACEHERRLWCGETVLLDDGIMDVSTVHAAVCRGPHMAMGAFEIQAVILDHQTLATGALHHDGLLGRYCGTHACEEKGTVIHGNE